MYTIVIETKSNRSIHK